MEGVLPEASQGHQGCAITPPCLQELRLPSTPVGFLLLSERVQLGNAQSSLVPQHPRPCRGSCLHQGLANRLGRRASLGRDWDSVTQGFRRGCSMERGGGADAREGCLLLYKLKGAKEGCPEECDQILLLLWEEAASKFSRVLPTYL